MEEQEEFNKRNVEFIYKSIEDAQNTIRFTDTKAAAVIGFWTLMVTIFIGLEVRILKVATNINHWTTAIFLLFLALFMIYLFIRSVWLAYLTLVPKSNPGEHIEKEGINTYGLFYLFGYNYSLPLKDRYLYQNKLDLKLAGSTKEHLESLNRLTNEQVLAELIFEQQKTSFIRNLKIDRVNLAITNIIVFLIVLLVILVYIAGDRLLTYSGGFSLFNLTFDTSLFIVMYIGHKMGDYIFQTEYQALNKSKLIGALVRHSLIYTLCVLGLAFIVTGFFSWLALIIIFVSHLVLDQRDFLITWGKRVKGMDSPSKKSSNMALVELDQAFHYLVIFFICFI
ncbi:DUF3307 domain-containing protein [Shouchella sp. 1P09AA]|uniref:DUF3307 domain-containing protein n=1 Tax=unclassified Shouchella TaxID=2893065 RepID=UPI0039A19380